MGRKCLLMLCLWALLFCLAACTPQAETPPVEENLPVQGEAQLPGYLPSEPNGTEMENQPLSTEESYRIVSKQYSRDMVALNYPQIENLANVELQNACNRILEDLALQDVDENYGPDDTYELNYVVMSQSPELISILLKGYRNTSGSAYPSAFVYSLNVDLLQGEVVALPDFADVEAIAAALLSGENYTQVSDLDPEAVSEYLEAKTKEDLAAELNRFDSGLGEGCSYIHEGQVHICLPVPHALGDYLDLIIDPSLLWA